MKVMKRSARNTGHWGSRSRGKRKSIESMTDRVGGG